MTESPLSLFLLSNLPPKASFGLDTKQWIVANFSGVKNIPSGLHLFTFSASPSSSNSTNLTDTITKGIGIRHGLLKFFSSTSSETIIEEWDNIQEELISDSLPEILNSPRIRSQPTPSSTSPSSIEIILSPSHLKSIDKSLAPYPSDLISPWNSITNHITPRTLYRVIGIDSRGNFRSDATMGTNADLMELSSRERIMRREEEKERIHQKGKEARKEEDEEEVVKEEVEKVEEVVEGGEEVLEFLRMEDSKRSWPNGAVGEEVTRWSQDKSWYLSNIILNQLGSESRDIQEYLAELQLSFTLFVLLHNFSSLTIYKSLFNLISSSPSLLHPVDPISSPTNPQLIQKASLPLYKSFLVMFRNQLLYLEKDFFALELPDLETFFLDNLSSLSNHLLQAGIQWDLQLSSSTTTTTGEEGPKMIWNLIVKEWEQVVILSREKFGWDLESLEKGLKRSKRDRARGEEVRKGYERGEDEVDLEDLEEGEDGPVIVEM